MFYISEIMTSEPQEYKNLLQKETYNALAQLKIPFERVDTDEAVTMNDCVLIDQKLNMKMVKTLFLCNRKKTILWMQRWDNNSTYSCIQPFLFLKRSSEHFFAILVTNLSFAALPALTVFSV